MLKKKLDITGRFFTNSLLLTMIYGKVLIIFIILIHIRLIVTLTQKPRVMLQFIKLRKLSRF